MSFFEIDSNFEIPKTLNIDSLDSYPTHKHMYGQTMEDVPSSLYWLEYQPMQVGDGTISFMRFLNIEYPEISKHVVDYLKRFFPRLELSEDRVGLLRTIGRIRSHIDEANRKCCINIGIKNSEGALTKVSETQDVSLYTHTAVTHQCIDGHAYLLNTNFRHEVISTNYNPRYLFTYGFSETFQHVKSFYKPIT